MIRELEGVGLDGGALLDLALDVAGRPCRAELTAVEVLDLRKGQGRSVF